MKPLVQLLVGLLPPNRGKNFVLRLLGHAIDSNARVGIVLLLGNARLELHEGARIGHLTAVRGARVTLADYAEIGQLNWISAASFLVDTSASPIAGQLVVDRHASITNRHYFDVSGGVRVGEFSTVAGVRSTFMTHGIDVESNLLVTRPIAVGEYCMVGGNCAAVLGATVPDRSIVGMGAVVIAGLVEPDGLYVGNPARLKRRASLGKYGRRTIGAVPWSAAE